jgi:hypothetical protein
MRDSESATGQAPSFQLSKWYLDCVTDDGDGVIVYAAGLRWRRWRVHYTHLLSFLGGKVASKSSIRDSKLPESADGTITVRAPRVGLEGVWKGRAVPAERKIFSDRDGEVVWKCLQPASQVKLTVNRSAVLTGLGYAELLRLTTAPWNLPLAELHWGRFVSENHCLVWIDWRGSYCWRQVIHNGMSREASAITEKEISFADSDGCLTLDRGLVLRAGVLGDTVLPAVRHLANTLPDSLFGVHECKWRSRAVLRTDSRTEEGWAIHEVVRWRKQ